MNQQHRLLCMNWAQRNGISYVAQSSPLHKGRTISRKPRQRSPASDVGGGALGEGRPHACGRSYAGCRRRGALRAGRRSCTGVSGRVLHRRFHTSSQGHRSANNHGRNYPGLVERWPILAEVRLKAVDVGPSSTNFRANSAAWAKIGSRSTSFDPSGTAAASDSTKVAPESAKFDQCCDDSDRF